MISVRLREVGPEWRHRRAVCGKAACPVLRGVWVATGEAACPGSNCEPTSQPKGEAGNPPPTGLSSTGGVPPIRQPGRMMPPTQQGICELSGLVSLWGLLTPPVLGEDPFPSY